MTRLEKLRKVFEGVEDEKRVVIDKLIEDVVFYETEMAKLKKLPQIQVKKKNPEVQRKTAASKLLKEYSQSYMNAIRILLGVLTKSDSDAADELLNKLKEFE